MRSGPQSACFFTEEVTEFFGLDPFVAEGERATYQGRSELRISYSGLLLICSHFFE